jgi:hypothetical protein
MPNHNGVHRRDRRHHNHHQQSQQISKKQPTSADMIMLPFQNSSIATSSKLVNELIASGGQSLANNCVKCEPIRILIFTESFHPYTSGIARRFKEIITRLAKRGFRLHVVTGCKVINNFGLQFYDSLFR